MAQDKERRSFADEDAGKAGQQMTGEHTKERRLDRRADRTARMTPEEIDRALRDEHVSQR